MAVREIYIWPDPVLCTVTKPVAQVTQETRTLIADMFDTMYAENGVGLAANQIGVNLRVLVIDLHAFTQAPWRLSIRRLCKHKGALFGKKAVYRCLASPITSLAKNPLL